jgi:hypothetical protein
MLTNVSVFNSKSYTEDMPDGYSDVVNEVVKESDERLEKKRKRARKAAKDKAESYQKSKDLEYNKKKALIET